MLFVKGKRVKGMLTVEASIMMPFLFILSISLIYLVIYVYDRTLIIQDVNALIAADRSSHKDYLRVYEEILTEHPYLSMKDIKIEKSRVKDKFTYKIGGYFINPVWNIFNQNISYEKQIEKKDIYKIMLVTEGLIFMEEDIDDSD